MCCRLLGNAAEGWVLDTTTSIPKTSNRSVVRPAFELLLHGLGEHGSIDIGVHRRFRGELAVEVGRITSINLPELADMKQKVDAI